MVRKVPKLRARVSRDRLDVTPLEREPGSEWLWGNWRVTMTDGRTSTYRTWSNAMAAARNTLRTFA